MPCRRSVFRECELTSLRRPNSTTRFHVALVVLLLLLPSLGADDTADPKRIDPALVQSFEAIREAFRSRRIAPMLSILPSNGKVFLAVKVIAPDASFYSRDQFEALFNRAFASVQTLRFHINVDLAGAAGDEGNLVLCPAAWTFVDHGARADLNLRFLLARQSERWTLSEIRESR